jgi:hypothetical protein
MEQDYPLSGHLHVLFPRIEVRQICRVVIASCIRDTSLFSIELVLTGLSMHWTTGEPLT